MTASGSGRRATLQAMTDDSPSGDDVAEVAADVLAVLLVGVPIPGMGVLTRRISRAVIDERRRRTSVALATAERLSGRTREELAQEIADDPALHPLLTRLLFAAGTNGHDRTLRAMGGALGEAVRERGRIDECDLLLQSLDGMTEDHVRLLNLISEPVPNGLDKWSPDALDAAHDLPALTYRLCRGSLVARGLTSEAADGGASYHDNTRVRLTEAGEAVLGVLRQYGTDGQ